MPSRLVAIPYVLYVGAVNEAKIFSAFGFDENLGGRLEHLTTIYGLSGKYHQYIISFLISLGSVVYYVI